MYERELGIIARRYFSKDEIRIINNISSAPNFAIFLDFDKSLGGIGLFNVNKGRSGRYHVEDRDILRPLQYIYMYLENKQDLLWYTRNIVQMSGLHMESIIKRFTGRNREPLGKSLYNKKIIEAFEPILRSELDLIAKMFNASKHDVDQYKDQHLFSLNDAFLCYFITRKLAIQLYPHIKLYTSPEVWNT